jgi:hypothetical protein
MKKPKDILYWVPNKFPKQQYYEISKLDSKKYDNKFVFHQFLGGRRAIIYRYLACIDSDKKFRQLVQKHSDTPPQPYRYKQERELFSFYTNGLSIFDCFVYSVFMLCAMINPNNFVVTEDNLRSINLRKTIDSLINFYSEENISIKFNYFFNSQDYRSFAKIRHTLSHRESPGRIIMATSGHKQKRHNAQWINGIEISEQTITLKLIWIEENLFELTECLNDFVKKYY